MVIQWVSFEFAVLFLTFSFAEAMEAEEEEESFNLIALAIAIPVLFTLIFVSLMYRQQIHHAGAVTYSALVGAPPGVNMQQYRNGKHVFNGNGIQNGSIKEYLDALSSESELDLDDSEKKPFIDPAS